MDYVVFCTEQLKIDCLQTGKNTLKNTFHPNCSEQEGSQLSCIIFGSNPIYTLIDTFLRLQPVNFKENIAPTAILYEYLTCPFQNGHLIFSHRTIRLPVSYEKSLRYRHVGRTFEDVVSILLYFFESLLELVFSIHLEHQ